MSMALALDKATAADFTNHVGSEFGVALEEGQPPIENLLLTEVVTGPVAAGTMRSPFVLVFEGPSGPGIPAQILHVTHEVLGAMDIYVAPLGRDAEKWRYQAIFN